MENLLSFILSTIFEFYLKVKANGLHFLGSFWLILVKYSYFTTLIITHL